MLHGTFLDADSDVVPFGHPMSEVIFEEEQSIDVIVFVSPETKHNYGLPRPLPSQEPSTLPSLCWLDTDIQEVVSLPEPLPLAAPGILGR